MTNRVDRWTNGRLKQCGAGSAVPWASAMEKYAGDWNWQDMANDDA